MEAGMPRNHAIEQQIQDFSIENFLFGDASTGLKNSDSFLAGGIIDSTLGMATRTKPAALA
jgi:hypothetical protein